MTSDRLALCVTGDDAADWLADFRRALPDLTVTLWPEAAPEATMAAVWKPSQAFFDAHPRLMEIFNLGAGVDALSSLQWAPTARLIRLEDCGMGAQMVEYVCHALLRHVREFDHYDADRLAGRWAPRPPRRPGDFPVGVMGLGVLGAQVARAAAGLGFTVHGWSRQRADVDGVHCHAGDEFDAFLAATRVLVCLLPLTPQTENLLDRRTLERLRPPGYLINVARGAHVVDADLLALIDEGRMAGACLDVFRSEPLPADHPFRRCAAITITPHISAQTLRSESIAQVAARVSAVIAGATVSGIVDRSQGY